MYKMIKVVCLFLWLGIFTNVFGQSMYGDQAKADVKVKYVHSLEEAMRLAKEQKKLIFFNCFADWATPCHSMNKVVFSDQEFGDYLNSNFVNLILDLSHKENIPIKDKYKVRFFAHYLVLDANGEIVHRIAGGSALPMFKEKVQRALDPKTSLVGMEKEYSKGNRSIKFLRSYFDVVADAGYEELAEDIRTQYLSKVPKTELAKAENWRMFQGMVEDINSDWFSYLKKEKSLFIKNNGKDKVKEFATMLYMRALMPYFSSTGGYTDEFMDDVMKGLKFFEIEPDSDAYVYYNLAYKRNRSSVADFVAYLEQHIGKIHDSFATGIDISLKNMVNVTEQEKELIMDYLSRRMTNMKGSSRQQYQTAIKEIKRENGIIFEQGEFALALKKAKAENKLIFLDAYTTWCGPCKMMAQQVFTMDEVGEYFNKTFVNFAMDMESGEGPKWAKEFKIKVYPTFLLINGDGKVVHKVTGAHRPKEFMDKIAKGTSKETSSVYLAEQYLAGNRAPGFVKDYIEVMQSAGEIRDANEFLNSYYDGLTAEMKNSMEIWPIIEKYGKHIDNKMWNAMIGNAALVNELSKDSTFMPAVESLYGAVLFGKIAKNEAGETYEKAKRDLAQLNIPANSLLKNMITVEKFVEKNDYTALVDFYKKDVQQMKDPKGKLNMDLLWKYLIASCNQDQKNTVLAYLKNQHASAGPRAVNSYKSLLDTLL